MSSINERVKAVMEFKGENPNSLGVKIGTSRQTVTNIVTNVNKPSHDFVQALLEYFPDVSADYLMRGVGPMVKEEKVVSGAYYNKQGNSRNDINVGRSEPAAATPTADVQFLQMQVQFFQDQIRILQEEKRMQQDQIRILQEEKSELRQLLKNNTNTLSTNT